MRTILSSLAILIFASQALAGEPGVPSSAPSPEQVSRQIDAVFEQAWQAQGLQPGPLADDGMFLRRVTLDLTGVIPEIGEGREFLADESADKRSRKIAELLARPRHAAHLANVWRELLLPRTVAESTATAFEGWLQARFHRNAPYDELVREILLARGTLGQSPPVLYYAAHNTKPAELAASSSKVFLGAQIRCAECHDHPFAEWRQDDFWALAAFFARTTGPSQDGGAARLDDVASGEVTHPKTMQTVSPRLLDGAEIALATAEPRRAVLARWITAAENPYFAQAAANRAWQLMFGRGLADPVDDLGSHTTPTHPAALKILSDDFRASRYDLRRMFQIVALTRAYQLASKTGQESDTALDDYTSMPVRSLTARQVYDSLLRAAGRRDPLDPANPLLRQERAAFLEELEAPTQRPIEFQGGIPQTLTMMNGDFLRKLTDPLDGDLVAALVDSRFLSSEERVEAIYLSALTRRPDADELQRSLEWIRVCENSGDGAQGLSDVLWALLNSSEFILKR